MDKHDDKREPLFETAAHEGALAPEALDRLLQRWTLLAAQLTPLVGERGFSALYARAAGLLVPAFGWLTVSPVNASSASLFAALRAALASVDAAAAQAANNALLTTFTKLLVAMIGEALTTRLLATASNDEFEQKHAQEHSQ